jgi:predicted signal transduction protein with EAL and GGDEF domain
VRQSLAAQRHAATALQLEITESLAAQDDAVKARLHELKSLGLRLALDDFGTGYSSLACLHLLPVDVVKIDRSFVSQVESSLHHRVLVEATILVARSLGMLTVAEGVETSGQAADARAAAVRQAARATCLPARSRPKRWTAGSRPRARTAWSRPGPGPAPPVRLAVLPFVARRLRFRRMVEPAAAASSYTARHFRVRVGSETEGVA